MPMTTESAEYGTIAYARQSLARAVEGGVVDPRDAARMLQGNTVTIDDFRIAQQAFEECETSGLKDYLGIETEEDRRRDQLDRLARDLYGAVEDAYVSEHGEKPKTARDKLYDGIFDTLSRWMGTPKAAANRDAGK